MGVIFATMFFLMFTPTKWVHHFGLFAAVGAATAALATVLVSHEVLRWSRNRMAFVAAVLFVRTAIESLSNDHSGMYFLRAGALSGLFGVAAIGFAKQIPKHRAPEKLVYSCRRASTGGSMAALRAG